MKDTKIEWCDHSWSPWRGCTKVSPGCANCYAETLSKRNPAVLGQWGKGKPRVLAKRWEEPKRWDRLAKARMHEADVIRAHGLHSARLPMLAKRPTVFPSLCDWLDDEVPVEWLAQFLQLIHDTPNLNWLLLTKRPKLWRERMDAAVDHFAVTDQNDSAAWLEAWTDCEDMPERGVWPSNVWVGTSVEDQTRADERIPELLKIPAVGRFLSVEPLLGPVDLEPFMTHGRDITDEGYSRLDGIHWAIIGGESGHGARPCNVDWVRSIVRQCKDASVPVFVKQLGAVAFDGRFEGKADPSSFDRCERLKLTHPKGGDPAEWPLDLRDAREFPEGLR
jgi:protein gp37